MTSRHQTDIPVPRTVAWTVLILVAAAVIGMFTQLQLLHWKVDLLVDGKEQVEENTRQIARLWWTFDGVE